MITKILNFLKKLRKPKNSYIETYRKNAKLKIQKSEDIIKNTWSNQGQIIKVEEAFNKFELKGELHYLSEGHPSNFLLIEGDLNIPGDLYLDRHHLGHAEGLIVTGNLSIEGSIVNLDSDFGLPLICFGKVSCYAIIGGASEMFFYEDCSVQKIIIGHRNNGYFYFFKNLKCPIVVIIDIHHFIVDQNFEGKVVYPYSNNCDAWRTFLNPKIGLPDTSNDIEERIELNLEFEWKEVLVPLILSKKEIF